ncbi:response regulator transcription factor [Halalkalibacter akibai]|uniref:Two-component response regulator yesN n=1 Tax=Halalkalibacter akibai (strain ATCC 43226 / DSM 21942 / CIP 109018 / JCM 9157 / 1139) TaxID=1236973 RepID=W4QQF5_HALA3|nr:response regulator transcription factor [Halalkalibacter akibai]GAE33564.1 two-component response regulator yesN [Halalkalibacter akibai JCM 9157]
MFRTVLVDDEVFVRQGLKSLIDWEECGFEVVAEAANGEDALKIIKDIKPDLVITDIRMPVLNGLELIEQTKEKLKVNSKFIIVSGYNDFSYAQKAVRWGVIDFVLKPIDQEDLQATLLKLRDKLEAEKANHTEKEKLLLNQIFTHTWAEVDKKKVDLLASLLGDFYKGGNYYYVNVELNNLTQTEQDAIQGKNSLIKDILSEAVEKLCKDPSYLAIYEQPDESTGFLITSNHLLKFKGTIDQLAEKIRTEIELTLNTPVMIYIGTKVSDLSDVKESYDTANSIRNYKYVLKNTNVIIYDEVKDLKTSYTELNNKLYISLMEQLEENNPSEIHHVINKIFSEFETHSFDPSAIKTSINRCVHKVIQTINDMDGEEKRIISLPAMTNWEKYNLTLDELKRLFTNYLLEGAVVIQELRKENMKGDIYKLKAYVEKNYHENISLKSIASKFYMNPVYLGQLFKKTFGVYFKEYLLTLRIDEAKNLLRKTDLRVYEIAEKVGFGSTDYFVTQFEKVSKMTPTEYRNQLLKK